MQGELEKLDANLGGVADMRKQPDSVFIVDLRKEQLAVREARRLGLPVIALVDTNCDPDEADFVIPGNDDAIRSCSLIVRALGDAIAEGKQRATPADFAPPAEEQQQEEQPAAEAAAPEAQAEPEPEAQAEPEPEAQAEPEAQPEPVPVPDAPEQEAS